MQLFYKFVMFSLFFVFYLFIFTDGLAFIVGNDVFWKIVDMANIFPFDGAMAMIYESISVATILTIVSMYFVLKK